MSRKVDGHVDVTITNDLRVGSIALIWALIESGDGRRSQLTISVDLKIAKLSSSYHSTSTDVLLLRTCLPTELVSANF